MSVTSSELEQLAHYKSRIQSTSVQQSEQQNLKSIKSIADDLMKIIKLEENVFSLEFKKVFTKQRQKQNMSEKLNRQYCTERNSREKNERNEMIKEIYYTNNKNEWMSVIDYNQVEKKQDKKDSFFFDQQLETSEYVPMHYERYQNPEHFETQKTINHQNVTQVSHNFAKKPPQNKTKASKIQSPKNNTKKNVQTAISAETPQNLPKTPPYTPRMQRKISQSLISPVKNFKKHILQEIEEKKQIEENQLALFMNKPKIELTQFYQTNQTHLPIYEKSKLLHIKKQHDIENNIIQKLESELNGTTFKPMVNKQTEKMIEGKSFESRMQEYEMKKESNHQRIIYEILQDFPFKPILNSNNLVESRIKKLWISEKKKNLYDEKILEQEEEKFSEMNDEAIRKANRDFFSLELEEKEAEEIFAD